MQLQNHGSNMEITRKWFGFHTIFLTGFALIWDLFLVFWYQKAFEHEAGLIFVLFTLLHVAIGVGLFCGINRTK